MHVCIYISSVRNCKTNAKLVPRQVCHHNQAQNCDSAQIKNSITALTCAIRASSSNNDHFRFAHDCGMISTRAGRLATYWRHKPVPLLRIEHVYIVVMLAFALSSKEEQKFALREHAAVPCCKYRYMRHAFYILSKIYWICLYCSGSWWEALSFAPTKLWRQKVRARIHCCTSTCAHAWLHECPGMCASRDALACLDMHTWVFECAGISVWTWMHTCRCLKMRSQVNNQSHSWVLIHTFKQRPIPARGAGAEPVTFGSNLVSVMRVCAHATWVIRTSVWMCMQTHIHTQLDKYVSLCIHAFRWIPN